MNYTLANQNQMADFYVEKSAFSGVKRIIKAVTRDLWRVTGKTPACFENLSEGENASFGLLVLTAGQSEFFEKLRAKGHFTEVVGKREVYEICYLTGEELGEGPMERVYLTVCGSDKRGTIYGLFYLSEYLGVSPWVDWADVPVKRRETVILTEDICKVSHEPSVRYRGFFINDEWPSFGNWTMERNGGFNAKLYERVFELLLRLKGNYLWPAMWSASFPLDGPGLENELLADELGVVISFSHHEPCMRASEEWDKVKGDDTKYGSAWNYATNREGLLNYWRDGLQRSGHFENIITIGMRGERDTSMLGPDATLSENIELLREIIREQRKLISEEVNPDVTKVPQMLALYKEVEAYFYGDENTPGLQGSPELSDVTLLLCEDNYGNMRTLPTEEMRNHPGGYGMYYHFDYHGGPISYEWVNSTPLTKVWEQMTQAYEYGVREIWVVNVGDLKPQELPLSYFLDLAYDYDRYGSKHPNETPDYIRNWVERQFGEFVTKDSYRTFGVSKDEYTAERETVLREITEVLQGYTFVNGLRRPEALNRRVYSPFENREAGKMLALSEELIVKCEHADRFLEHAARAAYYELVYYPVIASMNVLRMQIYAGLNSILLAENHPMADRFAALVGDCIAKDWTLIDCYHRVHGSKWIHMMNSLHVGFVNWNDEGSGYPTVYSRKRWNDLLEKPEGYLWPAGEAFSEEWLTGPCPDYLGQEETAPEIGVLANGTASVNAIGYTAKTDLEGASWSRLSGLGKTGNAMKVLPVGKRFPKGEGPAITYTFEVPEAGEYEVLLHVSPSNPAKLGAAMNYGLQVGDGEITVVNSIPGDYRAGDCFNWRWCQHVLENERVSRSRVSLPKGTASIRIYAMDPELVIQKVELRK